MPKTTREAPKPTKDLLARYADLRRRQKGEPITEAHIRGLCDVIAKEYLTVARACSVVGLAPRTIATAIGGDEPDRPDWREVIDRALAQAEVFWIDYGREGGSSRNTAQVNMAQFMLKTLNPRAYREYKKEQQGTITVQFIQGQEPIEAGEFKLIGAEEPAGLTEHGAE